MLRIATTASLALVAAVCSSPEPFAPAVTAPTASTAPVPHCQVPCGIYGDKLRVDLLMEDLATIEKAMGQIEELGAEAKNFNQIVRWVTTKDEHAQNVQDQIAEYWLAQRIKRPAEGADEATTSKYLHQLAVLHGITVDAMKCKQTTDVAHVQSARGAVGELVASYFSAEDLEHLNGSHGFGSDHEHGR